MKKASIILAVLSAVVIFFMAGAKNGSVEIFLRGCLDHKIAQCERKSAWIGSMGFSQKKHGEASLDQMNFYRNYKEDLIDRMIEQNIGKDLQKAEYFMIKAYKDYSNSRRSALTRR